MSRKQEFVDPPADRAPSPSEPLTRLAAALLTAAVLCALGAIIL